MKRTPQQKLEQLAALVRHQLLGFRDRGTMADITLYNIDTCVADVVGGECVFGEQTGWSARAHRSAPNGGRVQS